MPLDAAIVEIIDMEDCAVARLGEDAKHGEVVYLCKKCHNHKWKKHPKRGEHLKCEEGAPVFIFFREHRRGDKFMHTMHI